METPARALSDSAESTPYNRLVNTLEAHHESPAITCTAEPRGVLSPSPKKESTPLRRNEFLVSTKPFAPFWSFVGDILSYIVILYLFLIVAQVVSEESVVTCNFSPYQRSMNPDKLGFAPVSSAVRRFLFVYGIRLVEVIYCGVLITLLPAMRRALLYCYAIIFGMYFLGEVITELLKHYSGDMNCHSKHPNGVSGHSYFIAFNFWTIIYLGKVLRRSVTYSPTIPLIRLISLFFSMCCFGLEGFFSYYYGYHSVKQIVYGALIGMLFAAGAISASEYLLARDIARKTKVD